MQKYGTKNSCGMSRDSWLWQMLVITGLFWVDANQDDTLWNCSIIVSSHSWTGFVLCHMTAWVGSCALCAVSFSLYLVCGWKDELSHRLGNHAFKFWYLHSCALEYHCPVGGIGPFSTDDNSTTHILPLHPKARHSLQRKYMKQKWKFSLNDQGVTDSTCSLCKLSWVIETITNKLRWYSKDFTSRLSNIKTFMRSDGSVFRLVLILENESLCFHLTNIMVHHLRKCC